LADNFGYPVIQTDRAGSWIVDGYVSISDGYGTPVYTTVPSGIVSSIVRNSLGNYSIILKDAWFALEYFRADAVVPVGTYIGCQLNGWTVGNKAVLPKSAGGAGQKINFQFNTSGTPEEIPQGDGFVFEIILKRSSA
jgi:hypothetical protein